MCIFLCAYVRECGRKRVNRSYTNEEIGEIMKANNKADRFMSRDFD